jgi:hypothetical protein
VPSRSVGASDARAADSDRRPPCNHLRHCTSSAGHATSGPPLCDDGVQAPIVPALRGPSRAATARNCTPPASLRPRRSTRPSSPLRAGRRVSAAAPSGAAYLDFAQQLIPLTDVGGRIKGLAPFATATVAHDHGVDITTRVRRRWPTLRPNEASRWEAQRARRVPRSRRLPVSHLRLTDSGPTPVCQTFFWCAEAPAPDTSAAGASRVRHRSRSAALSALRGARAPESRGRVVDRRRR